MTELEQLQARIAVFHKREEQHVIDLAQAYSQAIETYDENVELRGELERIRRILERWIFEPIALRLIQDIDLILRPEAHRACGVVPDYPRAGGLSQRIEAPLVDDPPPM